MPFTAGCALAPPPTRDEVRAQAMPHVVVPATWTAAGAAQGDVRPNWLATLQEPRIDALVQRVNLYLALGGGFDAAPPQRTAHAAPEMQSAAASASKGER